VAHFDRPVGVELAHDYLWRVHQAAPPRGQIGIFNRSHYEDVVAAYLGGVVTNQVRRRRFGHIRHFEQMLTDEGTRIVKVFLHISPDEQARRLQARLDDPEKRWKIELSDLAMRKQWDAYQEAYGEAIEATSTDDAPWYVVPADQKWVRDVVVAKLLVELLADMDPQLPPSTVPADAKVV
jgi:PPK2 family polyphosphate:nucleotide phosphotransferase